MEGIFPLCTVGMYNTTESILTVGDEEYDIQDMETLLEKYQLTPDNINIYQKLFTQKIFRNYSQKLLQLSFFKILSQLLKKFILKIISLREFKIIIFWKI